MTENLVKITDFLLTLRHVQEISSSVLSPCLDEIGTDSRILSMSKTVPRLNPGLNKSLNGPRVYVYCESLISSPLPI